MTDAVSDDAIDRMTPNEYKSEVYYWLFNVHFVPADTAHDLIQRNGQRIMRGYREYIPQKQIADEIVGCA